MIIKNKNGFTLIEIMIAVAIFTILSSIMILNFRADAKTKELKNDCQKITDALRQMQSMALSGQQVKNSVGKILIPDAYKFWPYCQYGECHSIDLVASTSPNITLASIKLDKSKITRPSDMVINFFPPSADSEIWIGSATFTEAKIKVYHEQDSNLGRCIIYNSISGRIDILSISNCPNP